MAKDSLIFGPFSAIYIGDAASSSVLTLINVDTSGGVDFSDNMPEDYQACNGGPTQSGRRVIDLVINFAAATKQAVNTALGNLPNTGTYPDTPSLRKKLSIFLLHPQGKDEDESVYLPTCWAAKVVKTPYRKGNLSVFAVTLRYETPDWTTQAYYKRNNAACKTAMGSKSPI